MKKILEVFDDRVMLCDGCVYFFASVLGSGCLIVEMNRDWVCTLPSSRKQRGI
jgi:hypothetical protein